jgi:hypothetical protein
LNLGTARRNWGRDIRRHTRGGRHPISSRHGPGCSVGLYGAAHDRAVHPFVVPVIMVVVVMIMVVMVTVVLVMVFVLMFVFWMGGGRLMDVVWSRL